MTDLVVRSHRLVLAGGVRPASLHIDDGRITSIKDYDDIPGGAELIDAGPHVVMPGLVDTHVHVNEPGRTEWEGFETATRAAAAGGVTTILDMPLNSIPATTNLEALEQKRAAARGKCHVDVGFLGGVIPGNAGELAPLRAGGVFAFKCFLVPSGVDEFPAVAERDLREALPVLARLGVPLMVHAEHPDHIRAVTSADVRRYASWLDTRPVEGERKAIALMTRLARQAGAAIHIVHLSSASSLDVVRAARARGITVTVETCPHYLTFAAESIPAGATEYKCAPPIRTASEREALWDALAGDDIDLIVSDHSPCPPGMKQQPRGDFLAAWGGISSVELGLAVVWTGAHARGIGIDRVTRWMCEAPAGLAGLGRSKGRLASGYDADFIIFDPDGERTIGDAPLVARHPLTPYRGRTLRGIVKATYLGGRTVYDHGRFAPPAGRLLRSTA